MQILDASVIDADIGGLMVFIGQLACHTLKGVCIVVVILIFCIKSAFLEHFIASNSLKQIIALSRR